MNTSLRSPLMGESSSLSLEDILDESNKKISDSSEIKFTQNKGIYASNSFLSTIGRLLPFRSFFRGQLTQQKFEAGFDQLANIIGEKHDEKGVQVGVEKIFRDDFQEKVQNGTPITIKDIRDFFKKNMILGVQTGTSLKQEEEVSERCKQSISSPAPEKTQNIWSEKTYVPLEGGITCQHGEGLDTEDYPTAMTPRAFGQILGEKECTLLKNPPYGCVGLVETIEKRGLNAKKAIGEQAVAANKKLTSLNYFQALRTKLNGKEPTANTLEEARLAYNSGLPKGNLIAKEAFSPKMFKTILEGIDGENGLDEQIKKVENKLQDLKQYDNLSDDQIIAKYTVNLAAQDVDWKRFQVQVNGKLVNLGDQFDHVTVFKSAIKELTGEMLSDQQVHEMLVIISKDGRTAGFPTGKNIEIGLGFNTPEGDIKNGVKETVNITLSEDKQKILFSYRSADCYLGSVYVPNSEGKLEQISLNKDQDNNLVGPNSQRLAAHRAYTYTYTHPSGSTGLEKNSFESRFDLINSVQWYDNARLYEPKTIVDPLHQDVHEGEMSVSYQTDDHFNPNEINNLA